MGEGEGGPQKADKWNMDLSTLAPGQVVPENSFRRNYIEFFHEPLSLWDLYCDSDKGGGGKKIAHVIYGSPLGLMVLIYPHQSDSQSR